jgi:rhodanese-related sulfurtransferase
MDDVTTSAEATAHRYQSLFSDVAGVSSRELLRDSFLPSSIISTTSPTTQPQNWKLNGHNVLLVDVRTKSERDVSMISGAVSLDEFKANVLPSLESKLAAVDDDGDSALPDMIVTYCTIGFRSGVEARKLVHEYPNLFVRWDNDDDSTHEEGRTATTMVGNLDGMLAFANASLEYERSANDQSPNRIPMEPLIIDRKTNTPTNKIHVYGPSWKNYLSPSFEAITFSRFEFAWRGLLVLGRSCSSCNTNFVCCKR